MAEVSQGCTTENTPKTEMSHWVGTRLGIAFKTVNSCNAFWPKFCILFPVTKPALHFNFYLSTSVKARVPSDVLLLMYFFL